MLSADCKGMKNEMSEIKENFIKYVKLFSLLYIMINTCMQISYSIASATVFRFSFYIVFAMIVNTIITGAPTVLFIIYAFKFYGTEKSQVLLPISYIVSIVMSVFDMAQDFGNILSLLFDIINVGISIFLIIDCFSGFKHLKISKLSVIIGSGVSFVLILRSIVRSVFGYNLFIFVLGSLQYYIFNLVSNLMRFNAVLLMTAHIIFWNFAVVNKKTAPSEPDSECRNKDS